MKALLVKEDGLIYAAEVPEEPKLWKSGANYGLYYKQYEADLASAKESAVLVSDQEKARELIIRKGSISRDKDGFYQPIVGVHPIPDLQWEVDDSHNPEKQGYTYGGGYAADMMAYNGPVAILKESTPSTEQESQEEKTTVLKDLEEMVKKHGYASALQCASDDIVALRFELEQAEEKINSMSGDGDESQEELWDCLLLELEIIRYLSERTIPTLMNKFTITRKP